MQNKTLLRTQLRAKRRSLSPKQQRVAAKKLSFRISQSIAFKKAKNIAFYFANDGEICLKDTIKLAMKHRKRCFAPKCWNLQTYGHRTRMSTVNTALPRPLGYSPSLRRNRVQATQT